MAMFGCPVEENVKVFWRGDQPGVLNVMKSV